MKHSPSSRSGQRRATPPRPPTQQSQRDRARLIQLIHVGKAKLGLDAPTYRAMLENIGQAASCAAMSFSNLHKVLEHLKASGFAATGRAAYPGRPNTCDSKPMLLKIEALLADRKLSWKYASAIALRMFKKERLDFCSDAELHAIITALVAAAAKAKATPPVAA